MLAGSAVTLLDTSTAHRTAPDWAYGFPELGADYEAAVKTSSRIAVPGCHASGFIALVAPLVAAGLLSPAARLTCHSITGYSGGGKKMIAQYEEERKGEELYSPRVYGTTLRHKHLPEMQKISGLDTPPVFTPVVDDYYKGMATTIFLHNRYLVGQPTAKELSLILMAYYAGQPLVTVAPYSEEPAYLAANALAGTDKLELTVSGHEGQSIVIARFDNLGKGASGAAVQNMNLMLGFDMTCGLAL